MKLPDEFSIKAILPSNNTEKKLKLQIAHSEKCSWCYSEHGQVYFIRTKAPLKHREFVCLRSVCTHCFYFQTSNSWEARMLYDRHFRVLPKAERNIVKAIKTYKAARMLIGE